MHGTPACALVLLNLVAKAVSLTPLCLFMHQPITHCVLIYVDDIIVTGPSSSSISQQIRSL
jgi:hypothetical protein